MKARDYNSLVPGWGDRYNPMLQMVLIYPVKEN